jgi:hypothetical protein
MAPDFVGVIDSQRTAARICCENLNMDPGLRRGD